MWAGREVQVSLPLLVAMVVVGVSLVVALVHLTGGTVTATLDGDEAVRERFLVDFPDERPVRTFVDASRQNGFLLLQGGRVGIVHAIGDRFLTRIVAAEDMLEIRAESRTPPVLSFHFNDFTWPRATVEFADMDSAITIAHALGASNTVLEAA